MADVRRLVELTMVPELAKEVASQIADTVSKKPQVVALTPLTVTATTGTLPAAGGSAVVANAATPTVAELLDICMELKAKVDALVTALKA